MFSTTIGTYQLLGKRKIRNFGWWGDLSRSKNMSLVDLSPKYLAMRHLCSEEAHNEVVLSPQTPEKAKGKQYFQGDLQPWTLDSSGWGRMGRLTHSPSPPRQHLPWPEFQQLSGLVQTKTFGLSQIQNLSPTSPSQFTGVLGRHTLGQQELSGGPQGMCVSRGWWHRQDELERDKPQSRGKCSQSRISTGVKYLAIFTRSHCVPGTVPREAVWNTG